MNDFVSVWRAADAAARWHVDQRRKGAAQEPYINHLLEVANLVTAATGGTDPDAVIAALLHDAVEDQGVTAETIASEFGQHVADIVLDVTDDKTLPKAERKRRQIESAPQKSREAKLIKLADKTSNVRAVANSPAPDWSIERRLAYIAWAKEVVAGLRGTSPWLEQQFDEAIAVAEPRLIRRSRGVKKAGTLVLLDVRHWCKSRPRMLPQNGERRQTLARFSPIEAATLI